MKEHPRYLELPTVMYPEGLKMLEMLKMLRVERLGVVRQLTTQGQGRGEEPDGDGCDGHRASCWPR
jgi:hypothetical protein